MVVYLHAKYEVSSIILTSFRQAGGVILPLPPPTLSTSKRTSKNPTQIMVNEFCEMCVRNNMFWKTQKNLTYARN